MKEKKKKRNYVEKCYRNYVNCLLSYLKTLVSIDAEFKKESNFEMYPFEMSNNQWWIDTKWILEKKTFYFVEEKGGVIVFMSSKA